MLELQMLGEDEKVCSTCRQAKSLDEFNWASKARKERAGFCRECGRASLARSRAKRNANGKTRAYDLARREHARDYRLKRAYGLTHQEYDALLANQGGVCAICRGEQVGMIRKTGSAFGFAVDHDHETGAVRGLLCTNCNTILGHAFDNPAILTAAIEYLHRHRPAAR